MASDDKDIVLITGRNAGLGFEVARQLLGDHGHQFYCLIGCRTLWKGEAAVKKLHGDDLTGCEVLEIGVTSDVSISKAAKIVKQRFCRMDLLHVNASCFYMALRDLEMLSVIEAATALDKDMLPAGEAISKIVMETMRTNVAGAAQTAETFLPLLSKADNPRIVFMSSCLGSLAMQTSPNFTNKWPAYSASKAALNMIMLYFWKRHPDWKINACSPGFRGGAEPNIPLGKLADGAINAVRLRLLDKDGESGTFTHRDDVTGEIVTVSW